MIIRSLSEIGPDFGPSVVTIGNFDGVHIGHRRIFRRAAELGRELGAAPVVLTFDPHPAKIVAPEYAPRLLSTPEERAAIMQAEGIEHVLILRFDVEFAHLTPEQFVRDVLVGKLNSRAVLVGDNFHFGGGQAGTVTTLLELGARYGFRTEIINGVQLRGRMVSSTTVRNLIESGRVSLAARLLGRPYALEGAVVPGKGIGSKRTVPTLNLDTRAEVLPARGVYVTATTEIAGERRWPSITNVGVRPTFGGGALTIETFLLDPLLGADPGRIRVEFLWRVRAERKFESPAALKAQILRDVATARRLFRRIRALG